MQAPYPLLWDDSRHRHPSRRLRKFGTCRQHGKHDLTDSFFLPPGEARVRELKDVRFGTFICWSFNIFSGKEWTPCVKDIALFKSTGCDTDQRAKTAKEAGMGYHLFLTKHLDRFCLWDTKTTDRKLSRISVTPPYAFASTRSVGIRLRKWNVVPRV